MTTTVGPAQTTLQYLVREPKIQSEHPPVIFLLHGLGSNEEDLFSFASQFPEKYLVISARAPISLGGDRYAWYQVNFSTGKPVFNLQQEEESRSTLINFIIEIQEKYSVDRDEVYLCGFSQGGIMSYTIGLTRPDLVAGIIVLSGRLLEEIQPVIISGDKLQRLKVFILHGVEDSTLGVQYARQSASYLKTLNIDYSYKEYPVGHSISSEMLTDVALWLK